MVKSETFEDWKQINEAWERLAKDYTHFSRAYKKELHQNFNTECGTDYANRIFAIGNIAR